MSFWMCKHCSSVASRMISRLLLVCSVSFLLVQAQEREVTGILFEAPQNISAPYGFNVSIVCRGNGKIVWDFNEVQVRGPRRIEDFRDIGIFTNFDQLNESTTVILASTLTENYRIVCRVERGSILNGVEFQRSPIAYFGIFNIPSTPSNLAISTQGQDFVLSWTPSLIRDGENVTYAVTVENRVSGESRTTTALGTPFTFSDSLGERDCQTYEFTLVSMNQVGPSTNGIIGSEEVPTNPLKIMSSEVMTTVSLTGGPRATLVFNAPVPCSDYPITAYGVNYRAFSDSSDLSVPQEQRRSIAFLRPQPQVGSDMIELGASVNLMADRLVLVVIIATNSAGKTESEEISFRTISVQSASVTINDSYIGTVSCDFASGSTARGCMVSFNQVDSNGNGTFLFNLNINRSQPILNDVVFDEVPDGSEIVSTVRDVLLDGSVGLVSAPASVVGPFTPTTQPPTATTMPITTSTQTFTLAPPSSLSQETLYIIIGAGTGGVLLLLVLIILIACCICCCCSSNRKKAVIGATDELNGNHAYGGIHLTGANGMDSRSRNTYIAKENGDMTVSGMGPTYETIDDAKKAALEMKASNPIYASANNGSQANLIQGSKTNLVANPVYADPQNQNQNQNQNPAVSALNPIYSGVGNSAPIPVGGGPPPRHNPEFPYVSDTPLSPSSVPEPSANGTPRGPPHTQSSELLNHSASTDVVPPYADPAYAYAEVRGYQGARVRNAVSSSSDQEKRPPFRRNESYGMLTDGASPLTTSPPPPLPPPLQEDTLN